MVDNFVRILLGVDLDERQAENEVQNSLDNIAARLNLNLKNLNLGSVIGGAIGGAVTSAALSAISNIGASIGAITASSLEAARGLETLENAFNFAGIADTERQINKLFETSNRLGVSFRVASDGYKQLLFAFQGTELADQTGQVFEGLASALAARQATTEQQSRALIAVAQIAQKGRISAEEVRGQLAEALPGSIGALARSQGLTVAEFNVALDKGTLGEVADIIPRFAEQLRKESEISLLTFEDSNISRLAEFNNQIEQTQITIGQLLIPFNTLALQFGRLGLEGLNAGLGLLRNNVSGLIAVLGVLAAQKAIPIILSGPGFQGLIAGIKATQAALLGIGKSLIAIVAVSQGIKLLNAAFNSGSKELKVINAQLEETLKRVKGVAQEGRSFDLGAVNITGDILSDLRSLGQEQQKVFDSLGRARREAFESGNVGQGLILGLRQAGQAINVFGKTNQITDVLDLSADQRAIEDILDSASALRREIETNINAESVASARTAFQNLGAQIAGVRGEINLLKVEPGGIGATARLQELQGILADLTQRREGALEEIFGVTPVALDQTISRLKDTINFLEQLPSLSNDQAIALKTARSELERQVQLQEQYNSFLGESISLNKILSVTVSRVAANSALVNQQLDNQLKKQQLAIKELQVQGKISEDTANIGLFNIETENTEARLESVRANIERLTSDIFGALTPTSRQELQNIFDLTGVNEPVEQLIRNGALTGDVIKEIQNQFKNLKGVEVSGGVQGILDAIGLLGDLQGQSLDLNLEAVEAEVAQAQRIAEEEAARAQAALDDLRETIERINRVKEIRLSIVADNKLTAELETLGKAVSQSLDISVGENLQGLVDFSALQEQKAALEKAFVELDTEVKDAITSEAAPEIVNELRRERADIVSEVRQLDKELLGAQLAFQQQFKNATQDFTKDFAAAAQANASAASELEIFRLERAGADPREILNARLNALQEEKGIELELLQIDQARQLLAAKQLQLETQIAAEKARQKAVEAVEAFRENPEGLFNESEALRAVRELQLAEQQAALAEAGVGQLAKIAELTQDTLGRQFQLGQERLIAEAEDEGIRGVTRRSLAPTGIQQGIVGDITESLNRLGSEQPGILQEFIKSNSLDEQRNVLLDQLVTLNRPENNQVANAIKSTSGLSLLGGLGGFNQVGLGATAIGSSIRRQGRVSERRLEEVARREINQRPSVAVDGGININFEVAPVDANPDLARDVGDEVIARLTKAAQEVAT